MKVAKMLGNGGGCKLSLALVSQMLAGAALAGGEVVYQNDFSTRTSEKSVPSVEWQRTTYVTGYIQSPRAGSVGNGRSGILSGMLGDNNTQDGWLWAYDGNTTGESYFYRAENNGAVNKCAMLVNNNNTVTDPSKDHRTFFFQSFGNEFTNGILRMSFDLRAFEFTTVKNNNVFVGPIYKKYLDPWWGATLPKYAGFAGFNLFGQADKIHNYYYGGNGTGGVAATPVYNGSYKSQVTIGNWYRFVVDFDLDHNTFSGNVYAMGSTQPELATPNGELMDTLSSVHFYSDLSEDTGGFAGIVIRDCGSVSSPGGTFTDDQAPKLDNLRCWWRASGTDFGDADLFYENDFVTRRTRAFQPEPQTSATYARTEKTTTTTFTQYYRYSKFLKDTDAMKNRLVLPPSKNKTVQPIAFDGMRLLNGNSTLSFFNFTTNNNPRMIGMRLMGDGNPYGIFAQHLGERITSGKVRLSYDVRTPKSWIGSCPWIYGMLAPQTYYDSKDDDIQTTAYAFRAGFQGTANTATTKFAAIGSATQTANDAKTLTWYRVVGICDLDAKTFDAQIYEIGDTPITMDTEVTGDPVFTQTGVGLKNPSLADVSCFALFLGGTPAMTLDGAIHVDNVRIWKQATGAAEWTPLYANDFWQRTRYNVKETSCRLTEQNEVPGVDGWTMRANGLGQIATSGGENPALRYDGNDTDGCHFSWIVQSFGQAIRRGKVNFRADVKPPRVWTPGFTSNTGVMIGLGDDQMYSGNRAGGNADLNFLNHYQVRFGIGPEATGDTNEGYEINKYRVNRPFYFDRNGSRVYAVNGSNQKCDLDWTHWYRFEAKANVGAQTYDLAVYDMGTTQPALTTPTSTGTLVFTCEQKSFRMPLSDDSGLSTLNVCFEGCAKDSPWSEFAGGFDDGQAYVDNIEITRVVSGSIIIIR